MALEQSLTTMGPDLPLHSGNSLPFTHIGGERVKTVRSGAAMGIDLASKAPKARIK